MSFPPNRVNSNGNANVWNVNPPENLNNNNANNADGTRPGIEIHSDVRVTGIGSAADLYIVI